MRFCHFKLSRFKQKVNFTKLSLGPISLLVVAIILCFFLSFALIIFYGKYLPKLQAMVQGKETGEKSNWENWENLLAVMKIPCKKKLKIVYLKTHKVMQFHLTNLKATILLIVWIVKNWL